MTNFAIIPFVKQNNSLVKTDPEIASLIKKEHKRQLETLQLIPSENYTSQAVREAVGSVAMHKYSEGQAYKRYYQGAQYVDEIESLAKTRALKLFKLDPTVWHVNVQAVTGSIANMAVYNALLAPKAKIFSMYLMDGGHLSHAWQLPDGKKISISSKIFEPHYYKVDPKTFLFNYAEIAASAKRVKPNLIISGGTAYPREIKHEELAQVAKSVGALYMADVAHEAGLIAAGVNSSPFEHADVVTMTTRKTLRGPIGALIFCKKQYADAIDKSVFPGMQGGPMNNNIAGIAVALMEAQSSGFRKYSKQVVVNAQALAAELLKYDFKVLTGGTDKHLLLIDVMTKGLDGWTAAWALEYAGIIVNRNTIPYDSQSSFYPSGIRLGTPFVTTLGLKEKDMVKIAMLINDVVDQAVDSLANHDELPRKELKNVLAQIDYSDTKQKVKKLLAN